MGRLDVSLLQYLTSADIRVLTAVEMGMKSHELVPAPLVAQIANLRSGGVSKILRNILCEKRLVAYERGQRYDGYRLTNRGYDYLAIKSFSNRKILEGVGSQIGIGKESDIYVVKNPEGEMLCMKIHRLGRTSFRKLKEKRDYHNGRQMSWIYLSRISASKEFAYMGALKERGLPVPKPVDVSRHCVVMELVNGWTLQSIKEVGAPDQLYSDLMQLIVDFASNGVIHGDFNEFNIMVTDEQKPIIIDFPQMISTSHKNAKTLFTRDVDCIRTFFKRRFGFDSELFPVYERDVQRAYSLDKVIRASGYSKEIEEFDAYLDGKESSEDSDESSDNESDYSNESDDSKESVFHGLKKDETDDSSESGDTIITSETSDSDETMSNTSSEKLRISESKSISENVSESETKEMYPKSEKLEESKDRTDSFSVSSCEGNDSDSESQPSKSIDYNPALNATLNMYFQSLQSVEDTDQKPGLSTIPEDSLCQNLSQMKLCHKKQEDDTMSTTSSSRSLRRPKYAGLKQDNEARLRLIKKINQAGEAKNKMKQQGEEAPPLLEMLEESRENDDVLSKYSFSRASSVHSVESVSRRVKHEAKVKEDRLIPKKRLRAKGEAHAATRHKQENQRNIKGSLDCRDIWG